VFLPAILLLAAAAWISAGRLAVPAFAHAIGLITIFVVTFRLWDDLEDCERDRLAHPGRVLPQGPPRVFVVTLAALVIGNFVVLVAEPAAVAGLALLDAAAWWAYRGLRPRVSDAAWRYGVLPVKYPAFVLVTSVALGGPSWAAAVVAAVVTYAAACAYEAWHARSSSFRLRAAP
jgi:hypothetical protein